MSVLPAIGVPLSHAKLRLFGRYLAFRVGAQAETVPVTVGT
jgi:hypothetical protein